MVEVMKIIATSFKRSHAGRTTLSATDPAAGHPMPPLVGPFQKTKRTIRESELLIERFGSLESGGPGCKFWKLSYLLCLKYSSAL